MSDLAAGMPNLAPDRGAQWGRSFFIALGLHVALLGLLANWAVQRATPEAPPPAIMIDMIPTPQVPAQSPAETRHATKPEVPTIKQEPLPVAEKPEVDLRKVVPTRQVARPHPQAAKPQQREETSAPAATGPALAALPVEAKPAVAPNYLSTLFAHLERYKRYPRVFGERHVDLVVLVRAEISRTGQVLSLEIGKSSGSKTYDNAALSTFRRAEPLPSFPPSMTQPTLSLDVPVRFKRSE